MVRFRPCKRTYHRRDNGRVGTAQSCLRMRSPGRYTGCGMLRSRPRNAMTLWSTVAALVTSSVLATRTYFASARVIAPWPCRRSSGSGLVPTHGAGPVVTSPHVDPVAAVQNDVDCECRTHGTPWWSSWATPGSNRRPPCPVTSSPSRYASSVRHHRPSVRGGWSVPVGSLPSSLWRGPCFIRRPRTLHGVHTSS